MWGLQLSTIVYGSEQNTLLVVACAALGVQGRPSMVQHPEGGMGLFTARNIANRELAVDCYCTLFETQLGRKYKKGRHMEKV